MNSQQTRNDYLKHKMTHKPGLFGCLLFCALLFSNAVQATCSVYMNQAAINEVSKNHNWKLSSADFIEVLLLNSSLSSSVYNTWEVVICESSSSPICNTIALSSFTKTLPYFVRSGSDTYGYINWNGYFDVLLKDGSGHTIDYLSIDGYSAQSPGCTTPFDSTASTGSSTRRIRRMPDGTGDWDVPSGNSSPASEGESNVSIPASASTLAIADATAVQGSNMVFDISLPGNSYSVVVTYSTFDGTGVAGTDYTATTGSFTMSSGTTTASISIPTLVSGASTDKTFYLILDSVTNANTPDQVAIGHITVPVAGVDHYRYEYDGSALTCATETVTVKACANADCSTLYGSATDVTFDVATLTPTSASANLSFTGSTSIIVAEATATTLTMSMSASSPSSTLKCYENGTLDAGCDYSITDTGFLFLNETDNNQIITTQIAGKPSDVGYNSKTIVLQAVQTDTNTGACAPLFPNGSDVSVDLAYQCEDPGSCSSNVSITNNNNDYTLSNFTGPYASHSLRFAADSKATFSLTYPDVGKIKLHVKKSITLLDGEVKEMTGISNSFVVRPFGFNMALVGNAAATDNTGGVFTQAGQPFDMTLTAVQWEAGEDSDENGQPSSADDLSNNLATANFGQEGTTEGVTITNAIVSPVGGNNPEIGAGTISGFTNGVQTRTGMSWSDVGIISLTAALDGDSKYMETENVTTTLANVGRFVPNHFRLQASALNQACTTFSYMGQAANLAVQLEAQGVGDITLTNYDGGVGADFHGLSTFTLVAENSNSGVDLAARISGVAVPAWSNGVINTTLTPQFDRLTVDPWFDGPFDNLFIGMNVNDGDAGAVINLIDSVGGGTNMNAATIGACTIGGTCDALQLHAAEASFRYGRLNSDQIFGPATQSLTLPLFTEFWDGTNFILSATDSCSSIGADEVTMTGVVNLPFNATYNVLDMEGNTTVGTTTVDTTPVNATVTTLTSVNGIFDLILTAPTFNNGNIAGIVPFVIDVTDYPWLQFDWDTQGAGAVDVTLPSQNATFGQFRGNDRVIYWRERR